MKKKKTMDERPQCRVPLKNKLATLVKAFCLALFLGFVSGKPKRGRCMKKRRVRPAASRGATTAEELKVAAALPLVRHKLLTGTRLRISLSVQKLPFPHCHRKLFISSAVEKRLSASTSRYHIRNGMTHAGTHVDG